MPKVFVSGCFDMLHSGHVAFFYEAAAHGDLYVGVGSDRTLLELKGRAPINTEQERLYMIKSLRMIKDAWVNSGSGIIDFEDEIRKLNPDIFFVNEDGNTSAKAELCKKLNIRYVVGHRRPQTGLPVRSTTSYRQDCRIPYRIDLAGGWLDQPVVSSLHSGPVLTICIEPDYEFNDLSGMATSSRKKAIELWHTDLPANDKIKVAKTLFCYENPPGRKIISGSQDSLGLVMPGLNRFDYEGNFWPSNMTAFLDESVLSWIERHLRLIFIRQRRETYDVYKGACLTRENAAALSKAANSCWDAILNMDFAKFSDAFTESFRAQLSLFPEMFTPEVEETIAEYRHLISGWKLSGAGGGGYLVVLTETPRDDMMAIRIRRNY